MLENYVDILAVLVTVFGSLMSLAYFPQAYKMYKRKSSADISLITYSIFFIGMIFWLFYGIALGNPPLVIVNALGLIGSITVIIAYFVYKRS